MKKLLATYVTPRAHEIAKAIRKRFPNALAVEVYDLPLGISRIHIEAYASATRRWIFDRYPEFVEVQPQTEIPERLTELFP